MHVNTGHHHLREQIPSASVGSAQTQRDRPNSAGAPKLKPIEWISWPSLAGAPKLGERAQTRRESPNSAGGPKLGNSDDVSMRDPHCEVMLSGRTSHTRVESISFLSRIGSVRWVWRFNIRDQCFVIRWCCGGGVSSILAFRRETLPTLRYFPNDTKLALGMTLLELHWILQVFCVRQEDGGGANWGS